MKSIRASSNRILPESLILGLTLLVYPPIIQAISTLNAFTDANCVFRPRNPQPGHTDGECQSVTTPNTISVSIESLDPGCAVTIYADLYCSQEPIAKEINIGDCANLNGMLVRSFSVDECPPGTPDYPDLLGSNTTTTSSNRIPSSTSTSTPPSSSPSTKSGSSNRMVIIGGAVGGGVGLFMIVVSLIGWFLYKRGSKNKRRMETGWPDTGGYGRYAGDGGPGPNGYNTGHGYSRPNTLQQVGELEANNGSRSNTNTGNPYFKDQGNAVAARERGGGAMRGAGGSGVFENQVAGDVPLREIRRQELEAPVPMQVGKRGQQHSRTFGSGRERLPDMPRVPGVPSRDPY
ncbi:uncharacterized protein DFL_004449 [Arthrobotrys flagrans]|uniref:Mid2 domain-containing protein n=1 Tax=Arthrobotrys flagrans TaxID=97331 RepID=A0A437A4X9_ARTFL|nr:hypothetical protein DFL_004449 [Arthrobotrys flagrans]